MYTFSISSPSNPVELQFPVLPQVVAFAGSRRGLLPESITTSLVHAFYALDLTFLTGCATGIDGCFRQAIAKRPFEQRSMVACAFESRARRFDSRGLAAFAVVPDGLSPAAALHRRTVWMVRSCGLLVLFPSNPVFGRWGKGSILAFRIDSISYETVRRVLKKNEIKPCKKQGWVIPPDQNSSFVANMEKVLDVYKKPYNRRFPVVCMDESPKQLIRETRKPTRALPGQLERYDYEYERCGVCNIFMANEPLAGKRLVQITEKKTKTQIF